MNSFAAAVMLLSEARTIGPVRVARVTPFQPEGRKAPWYRIDLEDGERLVMSSRVMRQPPRVGFSYQFDLVADPRQGDMVYRARQVRTVVVDVVLFRPGAEGPEVLLIRRARSPYRGRWALPGGFVDPGESPIDAASREAEEETRIQVSGLQKIGLFDEPGRDPRQRHVQSHAYAAVGDFPDGQAGDDASDTRWVPLAQTDGMRLAFDHAAILGRAVEAMGDHLEAINK